MIIAAVCPPDLDNGNDGLIFIERISRMKKRQRISRKRDFSAVYWIDSELKASTEGWRQFFIPDTNMTVDDLADTLSQQFALDENTVQRLVVSYTHFEPNRNNGFNAKKIYVGGNSDLDKIIGKKFRPSEDSDELELTMDDLQLFVEYKKGDEMIEDISCDSEYMLDVLPRMAKAIRKKFEKYVPPNKLIYLQMDNAGGHGTNDAKQRYADLLLKDFNIKIVWQPPRSPELNLLDLGVWRTLQSRTEKVAYELRNTKDAIWTAANEAFSQTPPKKLTNVVERLKLVYSLIVDDDGDNNKVETQRGKLTSDPNPPEESSNARSL